MVFFQYMKLLGGNILSNRFEQLDSLRGLAALFVLFNHVLLVYPIFSGESKGDGLLYFLLQYTPLHLLWAGHESVLIFFVLSGFVLSLGYLNNRKRPYPQFLVKRICRLYIPFVVSLVLAIGMSRIFYGGPVLGGLSIWINNQWGAFSWGSVLEHFAFLGDFNTNLFNGPIWSLVHEMRISIIFPFLIMALLRLSIKQNIIIAGFLSVVGYGLTILTEGSSVSHFITLHYVSMFIFGALLAKHIESIMKFFKSLKVTHGLILFSVGTLLLSYDYWLLPKVKILHIGIISDWVSALGAIVLISCALGIPKIESLLLTKPLLFLGKISFSLYLYHFVVLLTMLHAFDNILPTWITALISIVISFVIASIMYVLVEKPSIKLGNKLVKRMRTEKNNEEVRAV